MRRILPAGLAIEEVVIGAGAVAESGSLVSIHYKLYLSRGDLVQDTRTSVAPCPVRIGSRACIAGLERGLIGMRVGGQRIIVVSPHLAYRDKGVPGLIPPNAVLRFDVQLIEATNESE